MKARIEKKIKFKWVDVQLPPDYKTINSQIHPYHSDWQIFHNPWCPLFGRLFTSDNRPASNQPQYAKCLEIINSARLIWNSFKRDEYNKILDDGQYDDRDRFECYPYPEEISFYPAEKLEAARTLFKYWEDLLPSIDLLRKELSLKEALEKAKRYYDIDIDSFNDLKEMYPNYLERVENLIKETYRDEFHIPWFPAEELVALIEKNAPIRAISGAEVFSIIAIHEAWKILRRILFLGENENNPEIVKAVKYADELLDRAEDEQIKYGHKVEHITYAYSEEGDKRQEKESDRLKKVQQAKTNKIDPIKSAYINEARRILKNAPDTKPHTIIGNIQDRIEARLVNKTLIGRKDSNRTIRRYIDPLFSNLRNKSTKKNSGQA